MEFGMPTLIGNKNLEESALLCKESGLHFIELNMNLPQYGIECIEKIDSFRKISEKYKIFYTIHLDENLNVCDFNKEVATAYLNTVKRTINVAKKLRIPILNMHMNKGVYFTLSKNRVYLFSEYNSNYMSHIKNFRRVCEDEIGSSNIKISIENTDGYLGYEKFAIEYLLESNVFSLTWDIGHSHAQKNIDEPFILNHIDKLSHFYIHDAINSDAHLVLGSGEIDLKSRLEIAKKYSCRCVIETKTIDALRKSIEWVDKQKNL